MPLSWKILQGHMLVHGPQFMVHCYLFHEASVCYIGLYEFPRLCYHLNNYPLPYLLALQGSIISQNYQS